MKKRIIWIEDDWKRLRDLVFPLKERGVEIFPVNTGENAVEIIKKEGPFDLILFDLILPHGLKIPFEDIYGLTLLKEIRKIFPSIPVYIISVVQENSVLERVNKLKVSKIVQKGTVDPYNLAEDIISIIENNTKR